jgi:hypothetical protein
VPLRLCGELQLEMQGWPGKADLPGELRRGREGLCRSGGEKASKGFGNAGACAISESPGCTPQLSFSEPSVVSKPSCAEPVVLLARDCDREGEKQPVFPRSMSTGGGNCASESDGAIAAVYNSTSSG